MPSYQQRRTFKAPADQVRQAAHDALSGLGSKVEEGEDGLALSGATGWSAFSFGENVEIMLEPDGAKTHVTVESSQRLRFALLDLGGRNRRNVGMVLTAMASQLSS